MILIQSITLGHRMRAAGLGTSRHGQLPYESSDPVQDLQRKTLREMLTKQEAESAARQGEALDHMQKLQQQNETQAELLGKQEALLERQGGQTEECNQRVRAAREVQALSSYFTRSHKGDWLLGCLLLVVWHS